MYSSPGPIWARRRQPVNGSVRHSTRATSSSHCRRIRPRKLCRISGASRTVIGSSIADRMSCQASCLSAAVTASRLRHSAAASRRMSIASARPGSFLPPGCCICSPIAALPGSRQYRRQHRTRHEPRCQVLEAARQGYMRRRTVRSSRTDGPGRDSPAAPAGIGAGALVRRAVRPGAGGSGSPRPSA